MHCIYFQFFLGTLISTASVRTPKILCSITNYYVHIPTFIYLRQLQYMTIRNAAQSLVIEYNIILTQCVLLLWKHYLLGTKGKKTRQEKWVHKKSSRLNRERQKTSQKSCLKKIQVQKITPAEIELEAEGKHEMRKKKSFNIIRNVINGVVKTKIHLSCWLELETMLLRRKKK